MIKNVPGSSHYFDFNETAFKVGIALLEKDGYHQIQRPHRKLPALMDYWEKTLKETGYPVTWYSKRIKGRRTVVHAVAGAHFINDISKPKNMRKIIDASPQNPRLLRNQFEQSRGVFFRETLSRNLSPKIGQNADLYKIWWGRNWAGVNNLQTGCSDKIINLHLMI